MKKACLPVSQFIDDLTNWYIRRSRRRFGIRSDSDKLNAYNTLHYILVELSKVLAPFMPFVSDAIYQNLTGKESVHLASWPEYQADLIDKQLLNKVTTTKDVYH